MTIDQLSLYNDALRIIGERALASLAEAREPRFRLDAVWDLGAVAHCLEVVKPRFAATVAKLNTPTTPVGHGYKHQHALPAEYIAQAGVFSDDHLDAPIERFLTDGRTVATDYATIYVRYIRDPADYAVWTPTFARVVSSYLAREISPRIVPDRAADIAAYHADAVKVAIELNMVEEPIPRARPGTASLSGDWFQIYNEALHIIGLPQMITKNDASERRAALDAALSQGVVQEEMEDTTWEWAIDSDRIFYNPSLNPDWGYKRVFDEPSDIAVVSGLYYDEYMQSPVKKYTRENGRIFCDEEEIYLQYISKSRIAQPSSWPLYFRRLISANLAKRVAGMLDGNLEAALAAYHEAQRRAKANDLRNSPPRKIQNGSWTQAKYQGHSRRTRP